MAHELSDGSIMPSYLGVRDPRMPRDTGTHTNVSLRTGVIQKIYYPTDVENVSKTMVEYTVEVTHADDYGATISTTYFAVPVMNIFGGVADFTRYTLRKPEIQPGGNQSDQLPNLVNGSTVLLMCINGRTTQAVIIGGVHVPTMPDDQQSDGHNWETMFNGVDVLINNDGEWTVTRNGPTNIEGNLKEGEEQNKQGGKVQLDKDGNFNVETPTNITLKSQGTLVGDATDHFMLGDTYRNAEHTLNETIASNLGSLGSQMAALGGVLQTAAQALNASLLPVAGQALATASGVFSSMQNNFSSIVTAINNFEGDATSYLSTKNKND